MFASVSLIAVGAFILTLAVVTYEVIMLRKKKDTSPQTVKLPDYQQDPKAVQSMTAVSNVANPNVPQQIQAEAPMRARQLPSTGKMIALGTGLIVVVLLIAGAFFLNSRRAERKITQANVEPTGKKDANAAVSASPTPRPTTAALVVQPSTSPTPTSVVTIIIESETDDDDISSNSASQSSGSGDKGGVSPTIEPTISSYESSSSATITQSVSTSPTEATMPKAGIVTNSLILGAISLFFIVVAFAL